MLSDTEVEKLIELRKSLLRRYPFVGTKLTDTSITLLGKDYVKARWRTIQVLKLPLTGEIE